MTPECEVDVVQLGDVPRPPGVLPFGVRIERWFGGRWHVVEVVPRRTKRGRTRGYRYLGVTYRSLTGVAEQITGWSVASGPAFFGLAAEHK